MKQKILVTHQLPKRPFDQLKNDFELIWPYDSAFSREELLELLPGSDVVVTVFGQSFDAELIEAGSELKLIANYGAGTDNIDVNKATQKGIIVTNTPDTVTEPTAELAMALILSVARRIPEFDRDLRQKKIDDWGVMQNLSTTLLGKTIGIVGMGSIGFSLARRAHAFGMKIIYHNRKRVEASFEEKYDAQYTDLENLLRNADFVSLNVPLTPETQKMIGSSELKLMKPSAFLINTARGQVIDEQALIEALQKKEIAGAGLDVFENEPSVPEDLLKLSNVVMVPHVGSATFDTREKMARQVTEIINDFFLNMRGLPVANSEVWDSPDLRI